MNSRLHGYLDYALILTLCAAPAGLHFSPLAGGCSYALAFLLWSLTLVTRYPLGYFKSVSFGKHGAVEFFVVLLLVMLPPALGFTNEIAARNFFWISAGALFLVWMLSSYQFDRRLIHVPVKHNRRHPEAAHS